MSLLGTLLIGRGALASNLDHHYNTPSEHEALYPVDATAVLKLWPRRAAGNGWRYLVSVDVGTPSQQLFLLLDTGSHQLLLRDAFRGACQSTEPPAYGECFNSSASTTLEDQRDEEISFSYVVDVDVDLNGRYHTATDVVMLDVPTHEAGSGVPVRISAYVALLEAASRGGIGPVDRVQHFLADASGVLGASHWREGPWQSMLRLLSGDTDTFALDLNRGGESRLVLGGSYNASQVEWSETQAAPDFHELLLFAPNVCGADLLGAVSGWWLALVDSGSSCLSLPEDLFYGLFRWVHPSLHTCNFELYSSTAANASTDVSARRCHLRREADPAELPRLTFRLSQTGRLLELPLAELLLPPHADGSREFCVRSHVSAAHGADSTRAVPILLGSQTLHAFYTVFQMRAGKARVGFVPKAPPTNRSLASLRAPPGCAPRPTCVGQQRYLAATNACEPPACAERYSRWYDAEAGVCVLSPSFEALALVLLVAFAVAELTLQEWQTRLPRASAQPDGEDDGEPAGREGEVPLPDSMLRRRPWTEDERDA